MTNMILSYPKVQDDDLVLEKDFDPSSILINTVKDDSDLDSGIGLPTTKDTVFRKLFDDKEKLLNLYEHQSTFNPNMPMRNLIYVCWKA